MKRRIKRRNNIFFKLLKHLIFFVSVGKSNYTRGEWWKKAEVVDGLVKLQPFLRDFQPNGEFFSRCFEGKKI